MNSLPPVFRRFLVVTILACAQIAGQCEIQKAPKIVIRTITAFVHLDADHYKTQVDEALVMLNAARARFEANGVDVETIRIATQPFPEYTSKLSSAQRVAMFRAIDQMAAENKFLVAVGPAMLTSDNDAEEVSQLAEILLETSQISGSVSVASDDGLHWKAIRASAHLIKLLEDKTQNSEGNFRFAAEAFVPPLTPFFPAAYYTGAEHAFSIGLQSAKVVEDAFQKPGDFEGAEAALADLLSKQATAVEAVAQEIARETQWSYAGIDLSPAPAGQVSIGAAIEKLTGSPVGSSGTLTTAALITRALRSIPVKRAGYSGLMLPILEDQRLAERWSEGRISLDALMAYSAVCGTGLDVVPLPGDISEQQLARIIGDLASLSYKWHKPLTARLMPMTGTMTGERTTFTDPRLTNVVVQPLSHAGSPK